MLEPDLSRLCTWDEVRAKLGSKYQTRETPEGHLEVSVPTAKGPVQLRRATVEGEAWLEAVAPISVVRNLPPTPVLNRNFSMSIGNFAIVDGQLLLRQLLPLEGVRVADLDETLSA